MTVSPDAVFDRSMRAKKDLLVVSLVRIMMGAFYLGCGWDPVGTRTWRNMNQILGLSQPVGSISWRSSRF
jgi:hypothetical protein